MEGSWSFERLDLQHVGKKCLEGVKCQRRDLPLELLEGEGMLELSEDEGGDYELLSADKVGCL